METLCSVILQGLMRRRRMLMALLFLVLEAISFVLDQIGGNQFGFLVASFVLSVIGFLMTCYIAIASTTDIENELIMIELAFSVVQLIMTYLYLVLSILRVEFKSSIASIFPLVLAGSTLVLAYRRNELVQDPTPKNQERDEEGFAGITVPQIHDHNVTTSDNLSRVNREEEIPDTRAFISPVDNSTVVNKTPDSRELPATTQSSIMVNEELTARISKQEEISEKLRASLLSSDTRMMSKDQKIANLTPKWSDVNEEIADPTAAPTTPAISFKTKLFSKPITTTDLEKGLIVPTEAMEHFQFPKGQDFVDLLVNDMKEEIQKFRLTVKPKPVLTEGWLEFVKSKIVVPKAIVTFYKQQMKDSEEQYGVEIDSINN